MPRVKTLGRAEFRDFKATRRENGRFFTLSTAPSPKGPLFACVVSKKTAPKAHDRNLIKRRCRAAFREVVVRAALMYVFTAKRAAAGAAYKEILAEMSDLLAH